MMTDRNWMCLRRQQLQISQDQLAERLNQHGVKRVTRAAVSSWEKGKSPLPLQTKISRNAFAQALELTIPQLLVVAGYELELEQSPEAVIVAAVFEQLQPDYREAVTNLVMHLRALQETAPQHRVQLSADGLPLAPHNDGRSAAAGRPPLVDGGEYRLTNKAV